MTKQKRFYRPLIKWLLRSPLHNRFSERFMLLGFTGRKSGKAYSIPVEYFPENDDIVYVITKRENVWWKNLKGDVAVTLHIKNKVQTGNAEVFVNDVDKYAKALNALFLKYPEKAKSLKATQADYENTSSKELKEAAQNKVVIRIKLT